jgi:hypothetical protein
MSGATPSLPPFRVQELYITIFTIYFRDFILFQMKVSSIGKLNFAYFVLYTPCILSQYS